VVLLARPAFAHGGLTGPSDNVATILAVLAIVALASWRRRRKSATTPRQRRLLLLLPGTAVVLVLAAVAAPSFVSTTPSKNRPTTTARLQVLSPEQGSTTGPDIDLRLRLIGGQVVPPTNVIATRLPPNKGHIHVLVDGKLVTMAYGLNQPIKGLAAGPHSVEVQFVAVDHAPFRNPVATSVLFTVGSPVPAASQ
jgi:MYXO-CTERM domain-containing protein